MQHNLFGNRPALITPDHIPDLHSRLDESREIVQKAITDNDPYAICLMLSGGDDSISALQVAIMLGVKIDFIIHGVTGTQLRGCREYVAAMAEKVNIPILYADAGAAFENYVKRKGFFGKGKNAHQYSYHILKDNPFGKIITQHIRKRIAGRKIILLNGVRIEESDNRADNFADNPYRWQASSPNNLWVNIIHWWSKKECLQLLSAENIQRSPVACALGRSGECNCGTVQNEADRLAAAEYDPEWAARLWQLRKYAIEKFGWDIGQNPDKKRLAEIKAATAAMDQYMPMCVGCKARQSVMFDF